MFNLVAQQTKITLLNGVTIQPINYTIGNEFTEISLLKKGKTKDYKLENSRIFSIESDGVEKLIYTYNPEIGNDVKVENVRAYIKGEQEALENYKAIGPSVGNGLINLGAGTLIGLSAVALPLPILSTFSTHLIPLRNPSAPDYMSVEETLYFTEGYKATAKSKRIKRSLLWGALGITGGIAASTMLSL